jgi:hypothetical protein
MRLILEFEDFMNKKSSTRTKEIDDEAFLNILKENCKNFSFDNDLLWRGSSKTFGDYGIWFESERKGTIGEYSYKKFFDDRKGYPVPRYKSLIGSTQKEGAAYFSSGLSSPPVFLLIPFDGSQIVFAGAPDLALWSRKKQEFSDDMFIMKEYDKGFKVPNDELFNIMGRTSISTYKELFVNKKLGFEFFTTSTSLLLHESKIDWLRNELK